MSARVQIPVNGEWLSPDPLGAAWWPARETLIVSDLHFEKGSSFAARGALLPPYDTRATLKRLAALFRRYRPKRVVSLGDAFHDRTAEARLGAEETRALETLTGAAEWLWILGNHDPEPPKRFAGAVAHVAEIGALVFVHEPTEGAAPGEVSGHLHPCARVVAEGRTLRRRCFAFCAGGESDARRGRLIMPAMGAYTGGLNMLDQAFDAILERPVAFVLGREDVYPVARANLAEDGRDRSASARRRRRVA